MKKALTLPGVFVATPILALLKLTGVIDWSWWWITAPWWGSVVLVALFFVGSLAVLGWKVMGTVEDFDPSRR